MLPTKHFIPRKKSCSYEYENILQNCHCLMACFNNTFLMTNTTSMYVTVSMIIWYTFTNMYIIHTHNRESACSWGGSRIDEIPYWTGQLGHSIHFLFSETMTNIILFTKEMIIVFFVVCHICCCLSLML